MAKFSGKRASAQLLHDLARTLLVHAAHEEAFGGGVVAGKGAGAGEGVGELHEQALDHGRVDLAEIGHDLGELLDLLVLHHLEQLGRMLFTQGKHEDCCLLGSCQPSIFIADFGHVTFPTKADRKVGEVALWLRMPALGAEPR
jgi:hypothetical protein